MYRYNYEKKPPFDIPALKRVWQILDNELAFVQKGKTDSVLDLETIKRNVAYEMQFMQFLILLYKKYYIYGAIESVVYRTTVITAANIYESLLYVACAQKNLKIKDLNGFYPVRELAEKNQIISKELSVELDAIYKIRNTLHPKRQSDTDLNVFTQGVADRAGEALSDLVMELNQLFGVTKKEEKLEPKICSNCKLEVITDFLCPNCQWMVM